MKQWIRNRKICISPTAAVVAILPPTARHGGGSGWKAAAVAVVVARGCGDGGGWCSGDDGVAVHGRDIVGKWEAPAGWRRLPPWWCRQWWLVGEGGRSDRSGYEEQFLRFAEKLAEKISGSGGGRL
nr:hypothetical protein [Tanacetum cinerariifolium]